MSTDSATPSVTDLAERLAKLLRTRVEGLVRLSGGASRETWAFDSVELNSGARRQLILRRDPPGAVNRDGMELEARLLATAARASMPVPAVRAAGPAAADRLQTSYLVMDRVAGESIARKILRDPEYATARTLLAGQCGTALARLHSVDPATVSGLVHVDPLEKYRTLYAELSAASSFRSEVVEWAFDWLDANRPHDRPQCVVHGDFRLGNILVGPEGLTAVLDWELAHIGDPMEDLGWLCVRAWRFGGAGEVGGFGSIDDLLRAYELAGGSADRTALNWWIVCGTLMWGVMCMMQANAHLSGVLQSVELAAIGRRVAEQEHDLLLLLAPDELNRAIADRSVTASDRVVPFSDPFGMPSAEALIDAVRGFLERDVMDATTGRVRFHARVAANVLATVARQLASSDGEQLTQSTQSLLSSGDRGAFGSATRVASMARDTVARLAVANPAHFEGGRRQSSPTQG